ncbi:hypothetical protein [Novosphingobium fuchskuhlense]|uniref:hypothetical protein n=1 Tax=Novosphingobium fuchskuhlense TaxID=1117702 RepID=UPI000A90A91D|nr:hypothetical protein [Novosphingobium fuchskuhlense]
MSGLSNPPRRTRKPAPRRAAANLRLPHPSWRLSGEAEAAGATLSAEDFWQKLGL